MRSEVHGLRLTESFEQSNRKRIRFSFEAETLKSLGIFIKGAKAGTKHV